MSAELTDVGRRQFVFDGQEQCSEYAFNVPSERFLFACEFADKDASRDFMRGVNFRAKDGKITMLGTDGVSLGIVEHESNYEWETKPADFNFTVPIKPLEMLLRAAEKDKGKQHISFKFNGNATISYSGYKVEVDFLENLENGDILDAVPTTFQRERRVDLNLDLLAKIRSAYKVLYPKKKTYTILKMKFSGRNKPILHEDAESNVKIVFMPILRRDGDDD